MVKLKKNKVRWRLMNKNVLCAVHDDDIESILKSIGMYECFLDQKIKCLFCNEVITFENLQCIIPDESKIKFCCSNSECYKQTISLSE